MAPKSTKSTPKKAAAPKKKATKKTPEEKAAEAQAEGVDAIEAEWRSLMNAQKNAASKTYSVKGVYIIGDKVKHPQFGEGLVGRLIFPNKMEVLFQTGHKILINGGMPPA